MASSDIFGKEHSLLESAKKRQFNIVHDVPKYLNYSGRHLFRQNALVNLNQLELIFVSTIINIYINHLKTLLGGNGIAFCTHMNIYYSVLATGREFRSYWVMGVLGRGQVKIHGPKVCFKWAKI